MYLVFIFLISLKVLHGFDIQPYRGDEDNYTDFSSERSIEVNAQESSTPDFHTHQPKRPDRPVCFLQAEDFFYAKRDVRLNFRGVDKCPYISNANETLIRKPSQYQRGLHFNTIYFNITSSGVYIIELNLLAFHDRYKSYEVTIRESHKRKGILSRFECHTNMYQTMQAIVSFHKGEIFFVNSETRGMNFEQSKMKIFKLHSFV